MNTVQQIYAYAGVKAAPKAYTPVTIGKLGKVRVNTPSSRNTFVSNLKDITFENADQMRNQYPEHVTIYNPIIPFTMKGGQLNTTPDDGYRAVVGDKTNLVYSIMSERYNPVQHSEVMEAMAIASEEMDVKLFGSIVDKRGSMIAHAYFQAPEVDLSQYANRQPHTDPFLLGVRIFNSHNGITSFGAEIFGIRMVCYNYGAYGASLGSVKLKHYEKNGSVVRDFGKIIKDFAGLVPNLGKRIANMANEQITIDEATAMLYGISLSPLHAETITDNLIGLNPDIRAGVKKIKVYDLYNASTAFVSYRAGGGNMMDGSIDLSHNIEKLMTEDYDTLIEKGAEKKQREDERIRKLAVNTNTTKIVQPKGW